MMFIQITLTSSETHKPVTLEHTELQNSERPPFHPGKGEPASESCSLLFTHTAE